MKSSCIAHPADEPILVVRQWQVDLCRGNRCAAALLSFFEYWHNVKIEIRKKNIEANRIAAMHGDEAGAVQDESLVQFHSETELIDGILGFYGREAIAAAIKQVLVPNGFITIFSNPNPKYKFDKTRHFIFWPEKVQQALDDRKIDNQQSENRLSSSENRRRQPEIRSAIPKTTSETTCLEQEQACIEPVGSPAVPDLPKKSPPKKRKEPNLSIGQKAYLAATDRLPPMKLLEMLDQAVYEKGEEHSTEVIKEWMRRNFHPNNISGICDVIRNGFYSERNGNGNGKNGSNGKDLRTNVERNLEQVDIAFDAIKRGIEAAKR